MSCSLVLSACTTGSSAEWEAKSQRGFEAFRDKRYDAAIAAYKDALAEARKFGAQNVKVFTSLKDLGRAQLAADDLDAAEKTFLQAIQLSVGSEGTQDYAVARDISHGLATIYQKRGQVQEADAAYMAALSAARQTDSQASYSNIAYDYKGFLDGIGRGEDAKKLIDDVNERQGAKPSSREIRIKYRKQADDAFAAKHLADAEKFYQLALKESRALNDAALIAKDTEGLAMVFLTKGNYGGAEMCLEDAKAYYQHAPKGFDRRSVPCLNALAVVYTHAGRHTEAQGVLKEILRLTEADDDPNPIVLANVLTNLGVTYERAGDYAREIPLLERARAMHKQAKNRDLYLTDTLRLIVAYREQKQTAKAAKLQKELNAAPMKADTLRKLIAHLSNAADKAGQKDLADAYMSVGKKL